MEDETFSADGLLLTIDGRSEHPGFAKDRMENALKIAGEILARLPKDRLSPESTAGREGFVHPVQMSGTAEQASIQFIIRDFATEQLSAHEAEIEALAKAALQAYPSSRYTIEIQEQYRNMKEVLDQFPQVATHAEEAIRRTGLAVRKGSIRGGTDGSRLSFMGLPCPNLFAGEHAFHSRQEWVSVQDMEKSAEMLVHLAMIWAEE
jgi:tripeptide aminopeptidase